MKTKNLFFIMFLMLFGAFLTSKAQSTEATNAITTGSFLGTSNNEDVIFQRNGFFSGNIGAYNTSFGLNSYNGTALKYNTAFGVYSLNGLTTGKHNTMMGHESGKSITTGSFNVGVGYRAGGQGGSHNTFVGTASGYLNLTGESNTYLGTNTGYYNSNGMSNIFIGYTAGGGLTATGGNSNILIGRYAGKELNGGSSNILLGTNVGERMIGGNKNVIFGEYAARDLNGAQYNVISGYYSGDKLTGNNNTILGPQAGRNFLAGNNNIMLGFKSGFDFAGGSHNVFIGGMDGLGAMSSTVIIGTGNGIQRIYVDSNGNTGIGLGNNVLPQNRLEIGSGLTGTSGLRFTSINENSTPVASNGRVLTVDANGDVVLTTDQGSGGSTLINAGNNITVTGNGSVASPYIISSTGGTSSNDNIYTIDGTLAGNRTVTMSSNRLMFDTDVSGAIYIGNRNDITNIDNFPMMNDSYRLFVEDGLLTEKVKVALRSTNNWSDFVFESDYKLPTLKEVEAFIKENRHLPGIESAEELVENGLDLADMQAKQMQKIEELTLYVIEQNKTLAKQSEEIEILKAQVKALLERK